MPVFQYSLPSETIKETLPPPEEILLMLSGSLLKSGDMKQALQHLLIKGPGDKLKGLVALLQQVKDMKDLLLKEYDSTPTLEELKRDLQARGESLVSMGLPDQKGSTNESLRKGGSRILDLAKEKKNVKKAQAFIDRMNLILQVERDLQRAIWGYDLNAIDSQKITDVLGEEARETWENLKKIKAELEKSGLLEEWKNTSRLTGKGFRIIGSKILKEIFDLMKRDLVGKHVTRFPGKGNIDIASSRPYAFGLPFHIDLPKTLMNAAIRQGQCTPLLLKPKDFEVFEPEDSTRSATVLMLDLSKSMKDRNNFFTAKKVALALNDLIRRKFPRDYLEIIGFSTCARRLLPEELPYLLWDADQPYTNIQDGLQLSRRILRQKGYYNKQVILITDGEPTAHSEGGSLHFQFPPHPKTVEYTLQEVKRCTRERILIHTFMLVKSNPLTNFVEELSKINQGRAYFTDSGHLGEDIIVNYLSRKK